MVLDVSLLSLAVVAGIATFFSPCVYALLPAYLGYFAHDTAPTPTTTGAILRGGSAGLGAIAALVLLSGLGIVVGEPLRTIFPALEVGIGLVLVVFGLVLLGGRYPHVTVPVPRPGGSTPGFVAFGAGYAAAGVGCVAPVFFSVTIAAAGTTPTMGLLVIGAYASSFAAMLVAAALLAATGSELAIGKVGPLSGRLPQLTGVVIALAGIIQVAIGLGWDPPLFG